LHFKRVSKDFPLITTSFGEACCGEGGGREGYMVGGNRQHTQEVNSLIDIILPVIAKAVMVQSIFLLSVSLSHITSEKGNFKSLIDIF